MDNFKINGHNFCNMMINASNKLELKKEMINSLNVFPVPDGDTGTNMSMTLKTAVREIEDCKDNDIGLIAKKIAKGALMGARGNSGVIFSQILRGIAKGLENKTEVNAQEFSHSIMEGAKYAYKAVMRPTEGTILTIIRSAGERAIKSDTKDVLELLNEICVYSRKVLDKTPEMLPALKEAKVVDAGGMGLLVIFEAMKEALEKKIEYSINDDVVQSSSNKPALTHINTSDIKYGYCTEFLIMANNVDVNSFKKEIEQYGDSMVVVGLEDVVKVHIHTNEPGIILTKALELGQLSKIKIDNMREQHNHILTNEAELNIPTNEHKKYAFISVSVGSGIKRIFEDLGTDYVIEGGQTMNPSTKEILECINKINADNIFILPNNKNIIMSANQAVELTEKNVCVIPSKTIPQGIAAVTVFNKEVDLDTNIRNMKEALQNVCTCKVTYAVRDTENEGKVIKQGDILGLIENKISQIGDNIYEVCEKIIDQTMNDDKELITIFYGKDCDKGEVEKLISRIENKYPDVDVQSYNGNQPLYYFIVSVE